MSFDLAQTASNVLSSAGTSAAIAASELTANISKFAEPQHSYRWEFVVHGIINSTEAVKFYAQNTAIPEQRSEPVRVRYCGSSMFYQGRSEFERTLTVRFYDNQDLDIYRFFNQWYSLTSFGIEEKAVNPINYMKRSEIRLLDTTDSIITESFFFDDCFPSGIGDVSLDYASSGVMMFDVTFQFNSMNVGYGVFDAIDDAQSAASGLRSLF